MGRIIFETDSITYELDRSDEDVLRSFQSLMGIKVILRGMPISTLESNEGSIPSSGKPFTHETLPSREQLIEYIRNHLNGYSVSMSLEHFFGYSPRYGVSKEQDRVIGTFSGRLLRAREEVEKAEAGKFETVQQGSVKLFVFKKNEMIPSEKNDIEGDDTELPAQEQIENEKTALKEW